MPRTRTSPTEEDRTHGPESSTEHKMAADEMEEEVDEVEEEEEEIEEEVDEDDESDREGTGVDPQKGSYGREMKASEEEKKKHADLLAFPPHELEVYLGGIPHDASEEDLKCFCETVGEVTEVRIMKGKYSGEGRSYAFVAFRTKELVS